MINQELEIRRAIERVAADVRRSALPDLQIELESVGRFADWRCSVSSMSPGGATGWFNVPGSDDEEEYAVELAELIPEYCFDDGTSPWPLCPVHSDHMLAAAIVDGIAYWLCSRKPSVRQRIGDLQLSSTWAPKYGE